MKNKVPITDRIIIWFMKKVSRINRIIELSCGEAYDLGYKRGMIDGSGKHGKKYQNKIKKVMRKKYKDIPKA